MKTRALALTLLLALLGGAALQAGELKIGVVRIQGIFQEYEYAKQMEESLRQRFKPMQEEANRLRQQIKEKQEELGPLVKRGTYLWKVKTHEMQGLAIKLDEVVGKMQNESREQKTIFYKNVYEAFRRTVAVFAKQNGYDLVITAPDTALSDEIEKANSPEAVQNEILLRRVQFISDRVDITTQIVDIMNRDYAARLKQSSGGGL